eukprot:91376-Pelagomonas_calceolata.AAC.5
MATSVGVGMPHQHISTHIPMGGAPAAGSSTTPVQTVGGGIEQWGTASGNAIPGALPALSPTAPAYTPIATPATTQQHPAAPAPAAAGLTAPGPLPGVE